MKKKNMHEKENYERVYRQQQTEGLFSGQEKIS